MAEDRIGFIGAGHISESLIRGIITSGHVDPGQIVISDIRAERLTELNRMLGPTIAESNTDNASQARIIFLAVKPAQIVDVAREIAPAITDRHVVISVAAGTSLRGIDEALDRRPRLCRIMPNLAASVRRSTISLYAEPALSEHDLAPVYSLLSKVGKVYRVEDEALMAVITALSGSAPAYYVMMADALVRYGVAQGMPEELATAMILGTMQGTAAWAMQGKVSLGDLWRRVVTPGGTTEAGMSYYDANNFVDIFVQGLKRSTERARELGDE
jgi:pyrroline-5-carboxylate reductase